MSLCNLRSSLQLVVHEGTSWDASVDAAAPVILSHHIPTPAARYTLRVVLGYVVPEVGRKHKQRTPSEGVHLLMLLEIHPMGVMRCIPREVQYDALGLCSSTLHVARCTLRVHAELL